MRDGSQRGVVDIATRLSHAPHSYIDARALPRRRTERHRERSVIQTLRHHAIPCAVRKVAAGVAIDGVGQARRAEPMKQQRRCQSRRARSQIDGVLIKVHHARRHRECD